MREQPLTHTHRCRGAALASEPGPVGFIVLKCRSCGARGLTAGDLEPRRPSRRPAPTGPAPMPPGLARYLADAASSQPSPGPVTPETSPTAPNPGASWHQPEPYRLADDPTTALTLDAARARLAQLGSQP